MRAREIKLEELFKGNVMYVSPSFHRPYAWSDGMCEKIFHVLSNKAGGVYFMGALVVMDLGIREPGYRKALLVDGNFRLLTLLVLLLALRDRLRKVDAAQADELDGICFLNHFQTSSPLFKNIVVRRDRAVFESLVRGEGPLQENHPLDDVYRFGSEFFSKWSNPFLLKWKSRFLERFSFVELALERDEDPYPVFRLFNPQDDDFTRIGLRAYTQFAADPELMSLIAGGESQEVEFKSHALMPGKKDNATQCTWTIARAVAGFLNSFTGGILLIGVEDDGRINGVEGEYAEADKGKSNWDGFELFLSNLLRSKLDGTNGFLHYQIERHSARQHDVCLIRVRPADGPTYIEKRFYVRMNNQTVEMMGPDLVDYVNVRFPATLPNQPGAEGGQNHEK